VSAVLVANTRDSGSKTRMTEAEVARARERAAAAGRPYPNLVDNMWVIRQRTQP
jgi:hypothetical protein